MDGRLEPKTSPRIRIAISGLLSKQPQAFDAIVDTGFTGFIAMPLPKALPLGLVLFSITQFTLANDQKESNFLCMGNVTFEDVKKVAVIAIGSGGDVLVGTEFLDVFGAIMHFDYGARTFTFRVGTHHQ